MNIRIRPFQESMVNIRYPLKYQMFNINAAWKISWKDGIIDDWRKSAYDINVQHINCNGFLCWGINNWQRENCSTDHHSYEISEPKVLSCTVVAWHKALWSRQQLMTRNMLLSLTSLVCIWQMDAYDYGEAVMNPLTLHINGWLFYLVGLCGCIGRVKLAWYGTLDMSRDDSGSLHVRKYSDRSLTYIHDHREFRRLWIIPVGKCDSRQIENCYRVAAGTLFWF